MTQVTESLTWNRACEVTEDRYKQELRDIARMIERLSTADRELKREILRKIRSHY